MNYDITHTDFIPQKDLICQSPSASERKRRWRNHFVLLLAKNIRRMRSSNAGMCAQAPFVCRVTTGCLSPSVRGVSRRGPQNLI